MKWTLITIVTAVGLVLTIPAHAQEAANTAEARAREAARQGPTELRRFIHRTRMIYALYFYDFYQPR
jgi:excinuclease UvrABC helicase subunit UvrB